MRTKQDYQEALDELEMNAVTWASNKGLTPNDDDITKLIKYSQLLQELIDNIKEKDEN